MRRGAGLGLALLVLRLAAGAAAAGGWERTITVETGLQGADAPAVWPVTAAVPAPDGGWTKAPLRLWAVDGAGRRQPAELQVLGDRAQPGARTSAVEICFFAGLAGGGAHEFVLAEARSEWTSGGGLRYEGEGPGLGLTVDTGPAVFRFHPESGQLFSYRPKMAGVEKDLGFWQGKSRPIHWNPDVWTPPRPWGHVSDWDVGSTDRVPRVSVARGALMCRTVREGEIPWTGGVRARVTYSLFRDMPFVLESSEMEFPSNIAVRAVRHNELVFSRGIHTHGAWAGRDGGPAEWLPIYDKADPKHFLGQIGRVDADVPWIALVHDEARYGIAIVNLWRRDSAPAGSGGAQDEDVHYYFNDYGDHGTGDRYEWNFAYMCRPLVFRDAVVPGGARYEERSAFVAFAVGPGEGDARLDGLRRLARWLREPPRVTVK